MVTAANVTLSAGHTTVVATSLFSVTDPDGNAITAYAFEDIGSGHFVLNGVVEANNQEIDVTAAQLPQLTYQGVAGSTTDTVEVRVNDGTLWSNWTSFTVTPPPTTIAIDGTTTLVQSGNNYFLDVTGSNTLGPEVTQGGVAVTPGTFVAVGAVHVAGGGYDVAWQEVGSSVSLRSGASTVTATSSPISATTWRAIAQRWKISRPSSARISTATATSDRRHRRRQRPSRSTARRPWFSPATTTSSTSPAATPWVPR